MKLVKTVEQCVKIKINQTFSPTTNSCMNYGLQMKAMSVIEIMSRQYSNLDEHYVLSFRRNLRSKQLIKLQYDTVENFVITLTGVIRKLNLMLPAS